MKPIIRWSLSLIGAAMAAGYATSARAAEPVIFRSGTGRFEIAGEGMAAGAVNAMAGEAWSLLATPLGLPDSFSSPVYVRIISAADWTDAVPFRVFVEPGGVVSMRLRWDASLPVLMIQRGLVQALLMRLAVANHGVRASLAAPLWLELACVGWWQSRLDGAQLDALKQETAGIVPPALSDLLRWERGAAEPRALAVGAVWLLTFLQAESTAGEWSSLLRALLAGDEPLAALARHFPRRFGADVERELWWEMGWHHLRRVHTLPSLPAVDSRAALAELSRFVLATDAEHDALVPLREVLAQSGEVWLDLELQRRASETNRLLPSLHPFYRNAGISLAAALSARASSPQRDELCRTFENDWRDALELDAASTATLDRLERQRRGAP